MFKPLRICGFALMLTACFRPNYTPQYVALPNEWRLDNNEASTLCNIAWWESFEDPLFNEYITIALRNNQDLKVAIERVLEFRAHLGVVNSARFPTLDGNASYARIESSLAIPGGLSVEQGGLPRGISRINNDFQAFFSLSWELDFWGRVASATEAAYADYLSKIEARRAVVLSLVTSVANGYIILRQLDAQLEVSEKTLESRIESLKLAKYRFELGETSEIEVKQAESEVEVAAIRVIEFQREIPKQENLLSILLGFNPGSIERGKAIGNFAYPLEIPTGLPSDLLTRRPDIIEAEDNLIAANARVTEARAQYFPQISLTGLFGNESSELHKLLTSPAQMWQYGLSAVQPIFNAGKTIFQVEEAKAVRNELLFRYRQTILNAFREVDDGLISYEKNRELVLEHQKQVKVLSDYLHLAQLRYNEGEIDYLNVLDAERQLFNAQLDLVQAQADSFVAVVQIYGALGGGWVVDADQIAVQATCLKQF